MSPELNTFIMFLLSFAAAALSIYTSEKKATLLQQDKDAYLPRIFFAESFYRAWIVNISFAGIAFAMAAQPSAEKRLVFTVFCHPFALTLTNFFAGALGAMMLRDDDEQPGSRTRKCRVAIYLFIGIASFLASAWAMSGYKYVDQGIAPPPQAMKTIAVPQQLPPQH